MARLGCATRCPQDPASCRSHPSAHGSPRLEFNVRPGPHEPIEQPPHDGKLLLHVGRRMGEELLAVRDHFGKIAKIAQLIPRVAALTTDITLKNCGASLAESFSRVNAPARRCART